jgi:hypothetical protein
VALLAQHSKLVSKYCRSARPSSATLLLRKVVARNTSVVAGQAAALPAGPVSSRNKHRGHYRLTARPQGIQTQHRTRCGDFAHEWPFGDRIPPWKCSPQPRALGSGAMTVLMHGDQSAQHMVSVELPARTLRLK